MGIAETGEQAGIVEAGHHLDAFAPTEKVEEARRGIRDEEPEQILGSRLGIAAADLCDEFLQRGLVEPVDAAGVADHHRTVTRCRTVFGGRLPDHQRQGDGGDAILGLQVLGIAVTDGPDLAEMRQQPAFHPAGDAGLERLPLHFRGRFEVIHQEDVRGNAGELGDQ